MPLDARFTAVAMATLAAAVALSIAVALDDVLPGELRLLREVQAWDVLGGDFADTVRFLTTTQVVVVTGIVAAITLWLFDERRAAVTLAIALVLLEIAQPLIKELIDRPRPTGDIVDIRASITSPSFPAGHVMSPTVLYGFLAAIAIARPAWLVALRIAIVTFAACLLVASGLVNLYLGVHWPTDILGGWLWGAVVVFVALAVARSLPLERWLNAKNRQ
jgi:undecaprenyl-diphosphatase